MASSTIEIRNANAKVNLALRITGKRSDGYHTISTLFQEIDLKDRLKFQKADDFNFSCSNPDLPQNNDNLCVAAYHQFRNRLAYSPPEHFAIHLEKNVPIGAGLGGGSSDAATVINFLNSYWNDPLSQQQLLDLSKDLGADVPFFLKGGTQAGNGIGDKLTEIEIRADFKILCVIPDFSISTKWAYSNFSLTNQKDRFNFERLISNGKPKWQLFENQFEKIISQSYPEISKIKRDLLEQGAKYAGLSGSGSTVIGVFEEDFPMDSILSKFNPYKTFITKPVKNI